MKTANKLLMIQSELVAPKDLENKFGHYMYRSCESILTALKPLIVKHEVTFYLTDEIVAVGNRIYVKAIATLIDGDIKTIACGYAREDESKKGMDACQVSGAASSYARKYALNALFLTDDNRDSDASNTHGHTEQAEKPATDHQEATKQAPTGDTHTVISYLDEVKPTKSAHYFQLVLKDGTKIGCGAHDAVLAKKAVESKEEVQIDWKNNEKGFKTCIKLIPVMPATEEMPF